jgi:hypothetical protein
MLYKETVAVCSENHAKHVNTLCEQNADAFVLKQAMPNISGYTKRILHSAKLFFKYDESVRNSLL